PPYDVLDEPAKARLQARHPNNIVTIDLPFTPPKSVGPDQVYEKAHITLQSWMSAGILAQDRRAAMYPYAQTYEHHGKTFHRRGFIALVKLCPFGAGQIIPHEKTYKGPIEDRLKLMRATGVQSSPIFGLFSDTRGEINKLLYRGAGKPEMDGMLDGVRNQLWSIIDADVENQIIELMNARPIHIADGHHRYTTALQYQADLEQRHGGPLPINHPANWCMFVLVSMQDDGLLILPTHRLIGGLKSFNIDQFKSAVSGAFTVEPTPLTADKLADYAHDILPSEPAHTFGLYDGTSKRLYRMTLKKPDLLADFEPNKSEAWRKLDVAILQRYLLDEILAPKFTDGEELARGFTAYGQEIAPMMNSGKYQIALLLKSTPLRALEDLGKHGEVMPQKSTFFVPKLATGMVLNKLT
ncbi:MAG: DUF1015 domain-containing protein, partial [Tepidisphaeraceae bacterium]